MKLKYLFVIPAVLFLTAAGISVYSLGLAAGIQKGGDMVMKACMKGEKVKVPDYLKKGRSS